MWIYLQLTLCHFSDFFLNFRHATLQNSCNIKKLYIQFTQSRVKLAFAAFMVLQTISDLVSAFTAVNGAKTFKGLMGKGMIWWLCHTPPEVRPSLNQTCSLFADIGSHSCPVSCSPYFPESKVSTSIWTWTLYAIMAVQQTTIECFHRASTHLDFTNIFFTIVTADSANQKSWSIW